MPKLLFSKICRYEFKDLIDNVNQRRRIDIVLSRRQGEKNVRLNLVQRTKNDIHPSKLRYAAALTGILMNCTTKLFRCLAAFRSFLRSEFSEENVEFWLACEDFKRIASPGDLCLKAEEIYQEFLHPTALREINVDHHVREKIKKSLVKPSSSCFDEAQRHVYQLMERDSCPRFLHSDNYLSLTRKTRSMWHM
ncbi:regulator of G-protein signaling 21 isoform X2 [Lampris incognitus]|uniref:regulator of G-protein signaling 21 isoform X2 n=1 Tax=Lampris incognitus TaxID=2546036 RepID=UPI0024B56F44|nr:regulator of G-protein signaling 21 isoform X2 [Lampris incognitus]